MSHNTTPEVSSSFNIAKIFSILSVILAHSRINDDSYYSAIAERIGCLGVVTFFFISGFFFNISKYGTGKFFKKKITSVIIPWAFLGSITFVISDHPKNFISWFNWVIGNGTYLYYLTVLMFSYGVFAFFNKKIFAYVFIFLNIISLFITSQGYLQYINLHEINNYLNPFNWIGFFSLGYIIKDKFTDVLHFLNKYAIYVLITYVIFLLFSVRLEDEYGYFSKFALVNEVMGMLLIFSISTFKFFNRVNFLRIADFTFTIYLTHFLVFPLRRFLIQNYWSQFLNPIIYMLACLLLIWIGREVAKRINLLKLYNTLLGIR
ncbi:acyltransferase family protein [Flavobacterium sp. WW92]|uniref:acyltransferase family protein n=1 Tax=unclassified Flavobacterium TaxID=196869 RepID=UPI002223F2C3|nr:MULTISPECIES: acyltransferase family protein [unclassified Flavobacterium]WDO14471.1 acyltransferase family protein [Flavobacterium sp. WW92]